MKHAHTETRTCSHLGGVLADGSESKTQIKITKSIQSTKNRDSNFSIRTTAVLRRPPRWLARSFFASVERGMHALGDVTRDWFRFGAFVAPSAWQKEVGVHASITCEAVRYLRPRPPVQWPH